ncbi:MAG TPA: HRDC domain-containing protein [Verrucomicrobiae bacterium]|nr:HRDC domain-containing protein [Verrucomicrobiae bacterium]
MIDSDGKLAEFLPELQSAEWIALDTEADSLHAYPEKLCLIQISILHHDKLVDPLATIDLTPLWPALKKHQLILHGADYDLRLLRKMCGFVPSRIFDTMLASRLLGEREFGLGNLVKKHLGIALEKGSQKADWSKRPLTPRMEAYARSDTRHLKPVADILAEQLRQKDRLKWLEQSCDRLIAECAIPMKPEPDLVWRIKGCHQLPPKALAVLREIWRWREDEAMAANRPPYFVLSHETVIAISSTATNHGGIEPLLPRHFSSRRKDGLLEAIQRGLALAPEEHPQPLRSNSRRQTDAERRRFVALEEGRNRRANGLQLDPTLIASRATLIELAEDWDRYNGELMEWQREILTPFKG